MKRKLAEEVDSGGKSRSSNEKKVRPSEVPEYLRNTEFYRSLDKEDDEAFYIPDGHCKADVEVETLDDVCGKS